MTDETTITTTDATEVDLEEYRSRQQVAVLGRRIKALLPGGEDLTDNQAMAIAQYSLVMDANPYRGEIYGWVDKKGKFHLTEGYKLLVRWAKRTSPYVEKYEALNLNGGDIGYSCFILRQDHRHFLQEMVQAGASFQEAFNIAATEGRGVIVKGEQHGYPPKGWTWDDVARKRALKNALNLAFGAPSPREIAAESWIVDGIETKPEDWQDTTPQMSQADREAHAEWRARGRQVREEMLEQSAEAIIDELWDDEPDPIVGPPPEPEPPRRRSPSFNADTLDLVVQAGYAKDRPSAARRLGKSQQLSNRDAAEIVIGWVGTYDALRKVGKTPDEAMAEADAELYAELHSEEKEAF